MYHCECVPRNSIVEMYHAGTTSSVKEHATQLMSEDCSHLRILIATVAFGMGVNCKKVRRTIHLDLQKTLNNMCKNQEELEGMVNKAHVCYCLMAFWPLAVKKK